MTSEEAVDRARSALDLEPSVRGEAWLVHRLDRPSDYFLVVLGEPEAAVGVAAVDAADGEVLSSARLAGAGPHLPVTSEEAVRLSGMSAETSRARLVWRPSRQSRSPLYPLWEVREGDELVYVDQQRAARRRLDPGGAGGTALPL